MNYEIVNSVNVYYDITGIRSGDAPGTRHRRRQVSYIFLFYFEIEENCETRVCLKLQKITDDDKTKK